MVECRLRFSSWSLVQPESPLTTFREHTAVPSTKGTDCFADHSEADGKIESPVTKGVSECTTYRFHKAQCGWAIQFAAGESLEVR